MVLYFIFTALENFHHIQTLYDNPQENISLNLLYFQVTGVHLMLFRYCKYVTRIGKSVVWRLTVESVLALVSESVGRDVEIMMILTTRSILASHNTM